MIVCALRTNARPRRGYTHELAFVLPGDMEPDGEPVTLGDGVIDDELRTRKCRPQRFVEAAVGSMVERLRREPVMDDGRVVQLEVSLAVSGIPSVDCRGKNISLLVGHGLPFLRQELVSLPPARRGPGEHGP